MGMAGYAIIGLLHLSGLIRQPGRGTHDLMPGSSGQSDGLQLLEPEAGSGIDSSYSLSHVKSAHRLGPGIGIGKVHPISALLRSGQDSGKLGLACGNRSHDTVQLLLHQPDGSSGSQNLKRVGVEQCHLRRVQKFPLGSDERIHGQDDIAVSLRSQGIAGLLLGRAVGYDYGGSALEFLPGSGWAGRCRIGAAYDHQLRSPDLQLLGGLALFFCHLGAEADDLELDVGALRNLIQGQIYDRGCGYIS